MYQPRAPIAPAAAYAAVDRAARVLAASPHELVAILYGEAQLTLAVMRRAQTRGDRRLYADRQERALALFAALEAGLDYRNGGDVADALGGVYVAIANALRNEPLAGDGGAIRDAERAMADLVQAWTAIRP
jgi:flagellar secretion chaperone FliS